MSVYVDPIMQKIEDLIRDGCGGSIKTFYHGDPILIAQSNLPALIISKDTTEIDDFSNAEDYHRMRIALNLVIDIRDYLRETDHSTAHLASQKLYDVMEGRDDTTWKLKSTSIVDILRKNHGLQNNANIDLQVPMVVDYGLTIGKRGEKNWSWEANILISIYFAQMRSN